MLSKPKRSPRPLKSFVARSSRSTFGACLFALVVFSAIAHAATPERALMAREAQLYLSPDPTSQKIGIVGRGREVAIIETSNDWSHVLAVVETGASVRREEETPERNVTGWMRSKGIIRTSTPNGDAVLYGEAVDSEAQATKRRGRKGAAEDALRLYERMAEYFPKSPLAGEAAFRAADIRWQLEREEVRARPASRQLDPVMRPQMAEDQLKQVQKKFPNTKWADLAAYD